MLDKEILNCAEREGSRQFEKLTGGPSSGGMIILLFPPGLMSRIPSSNPA
jgi:hypothetical protein